MNFNLSMQRHEEQRRWLLEIYQAALEAVAGAARHGERSEGG